MELLPHWNVEQLEPKPGGLSKSVCIAMLWVHLWGWFLWVQGRFKWYINSWIMLCATSFQCAHMCDLLPLVLQCPSIPRLWCIQHAARECWSLVQPLWGHQVEVSVTASPWERHLRDTVIHVLLTCPAHVVLGREGLVLPKTIVGKHSWPHTQLSTCFSRDTSPCHHPTLDTGYFQCSIHPPASQCVPPHPCDWSFPRSISISIKLVAFGFDLLMTVKMTLESTRHRETLSGTLLCIFFQSQSRKGEYNRVDDECFKPQNWYVLSLIV